MSDTLETVLEAYGNKVIGMGAGGSGGHSIIDAEGTTMPQEDAMQFADAFVSDDPTNSKTIVENIKEVSPADYASTTDEGIIVCDDGDDAVIHPSSDDKVEVTADGVKTYQALLNEIFNDPKFDITKISEKSTLKIDPFVLYFGSFGYNSATFNGGAPNGNNAFVELSATIETSNSVYNWLNVTTSGTTSTDKSTDKPTSGTKITLYYGNRKATVDLQTTANRCLYDSNTTVKQKIDGMESLPSSVRAWSGDTLKFSIPQSNGVIYKFIAMNNVGDLVEACLINRTDGIKVAHTSALTMSATYANGELTVTLPSTSYWVYSLTAIKSRY